MATVATVEFNKETLGKMKKITSLNEMTELISQMNNRILRESWKWIMDERKQDTLKDHLSMHKERVENRSNEDNLCNNALITMLELAIKLRFPTSN